MGIAGRRWVGAGAGLVVCVLCVLCIVCVMCACVCVSTCAHTCPCVLSWARAPQGPDWGMS